MLYNDSAEARPHRPTTAQRPQRPYRTARRHKRFASASYSTDQLAPLPEYRSSRPPHLLLDQPSNQPTSSIWDGESPPPTYPGLSSPRRPAFLDDDEDEGFGGSYAAVAIPRATPRKLRRRSSIGGTNDRLDSLLERSVMALEASTALLQSSVTTHNTLSAVLEDTSFDRSMDMQIRYLARRMGVEGSQQEQDNGLDKVLEEVVGLLSDPHYQSARNAAADDEAVSRSLPAEDHMRQLRASRTDADPPLRPAASQRRLRLSDGPRPRSPPPRPFTQYVSIESPNGLAFEATSTSASILLPSTSGIRAPPLQTSLLSPSISAPTTPLKSTTSQPSVPLSASSLLMRIHSRSSSLTRSASPDILSRSFTTNFMSAAAKRQDGDASPKLPRGRGMGASKPNTHVMSAADLVPTTLLGTLNTWPHRTRSQSIDHHHHPSVIRHRIMDSTSSAPAGSSSTVDPASSQPSLGAAIDQVGNDVPAPSTSYKVSLSLRKILDESEKLRNVPASDVASGKQRAAGEWPEASQRHSRRSSSAHRRPTALNAVVVPSISQPMLTHDTSTSHVDDIQYILAPRRQSVASTDSPASTPSTMKRRSALKGSSGRTTPLSSGQSSPRVVTFSPLPPKHESDGSVGRAKAKSKARARTREEEKEPETHGWWSDWLLGPSEIGSGKGRQPTPVHTRTGSMLREEGRWTSGGMESWQV